MTGREGDGWGVLTVYEKRNIIAICKQRLREKKYG